MAEPSEGSEKDEMTEPSEDLEKDEMAGSSETTEKDDMARPSEAVEKDKMVASSEGFGEAGPRSIASAKSTKEDIDALREELKLEKDTKQLVKLSDIRIKLAHYESDSTWQKAILLCIVGHL
ncbi:hypothetical protein LIER_12763 [Lithospermum erythrorhizon]|uniref:Uncharacterized protein n=1 Tax=Lithospermum erythrorhizon TaxID=34254 RepID=A0AAV3PT63_LITER